MEFLRFLEGLRTPFLDVFFQFITMFGEETVFILIGILFFWCIDKKHGYYLLSVGFFGIVLNQFLKICFRIPRPWVLDKEFTIVESARAQATGYSFPSGHTQTSVGAFGGIARFTKKTWVRIVCIIICLLVPISRMYLGVHTPKDVGVSLVIALILIFTLYPLMQKALASRKGMRIFFGSIATISTAFLIFVLYYPFLDIDISNYEHAVENTYKILGCSLGMWFAYEIDDHFIHFETKAIWWAQILKVILGAIPLLAVKILLKEPLYALFDGNFVADGIRYFLVVAIAGGIWPLTFKWFSKLGTAKQ